MSPLWLTVIWAPSDELISEIGTPVATDSHAGCPSCSVKVEVIS